MELKIKNIVNDCLKQIKQLPSEANRAMQLLNDIRVKYLGKNGELTALLRSMKDIKPEDRPMFGQQVNAAQDEIKGFIDGAEKDIQSKVLLEKLKTEKVDISLPVKGECLGNLHPITIIERQITSIFTNIGFEVLEGPEIESDSYNFEKLNIPKDHPARDMQDSFYISESILLRTHTSPNQARVMEKKKPPIKMLCPGRVYRSDDDASHSPIFHQIEGLVVDKHVTLSDLKGTLEFMLKELFSKETKARFRPSYFPFTEPSVEVDMTCSNCGGKGCNVCKGTGWVEILGAGMVNPKVLKNCGIDPNVYSGFAFGVGLDRVAMIKFGIPHIRLMYESDVRFLKQFR